MFLNKYYKFILKPRVYGKYFDPATFHFILPGQTYSYVGACVTKSKRKSRQLLSEYFARHPILSSIYEGRICLCRVKKEDIVEQKNGIIFVETYTVLKIYDKDYAQNVQ
jgi:hypothetical protein